MADERHPQCVLVAPEMVGTRALADWLTEKGFPAEPSMPAAIANPGDAIGLTEEEFTGIEVRVVNPEHVEPAKAAIAAMHEEVAAVREKQKVRAERTGTVTAGCEECGKSSEWPASSMGTTETCPHCSSFMDVPDPDVNKGLERVARLLNLYGSAGLKASDVKVAVVFHGEATKTVLADAAWGDCSNATNAVPASTTFA